MGTALARIRLALFLAGAFFLSVAHAQNAGAIYTGTFNGQTRTGPTHAGVCNDLLSVVMQVDSTIVRSVPYEFNVGQGLQPFCAFQTQPQTGTAGKYGAQLSFSCQAGYTQSGLQCIPPVCPAGATLERTFFAGWNSASGGDLDTEVPGSDPDGARNFTCDGTCTVGYKEVISCQTNVEADSNGYYKQTCTFAYTKTGATCATSDAPAGPNDSPPLPPDTPDPNPGGDDPTGPDPNDPCTAEQIANGTCSGDGPGDGPGDDEPKKDPNACSAAQIANGTCPGSGSQPIGGVGGSTPVPDDPATCGGEGQPLCRVQVNESGTTDGSGHLETMKGHGDQVTELSKEDGTFWTTVKLYLQKTAKDLAGWTWTFSLPTGCTPINLTGYDLTIDICEFQGTIHDLMGFLWVLCTIYGLIRLFIWGID